MQNDGVCRFERRQRQGEIATAPHINRGATNKFHIANCGIDLCTIAHQQHVRPNSGQQGPLETVSGCERFGDIDLHLPDNVIGCPPPQSFHRQFSPTTRTRRRYVAQQVCADRTVSTLCRSRSTSVKDERGAVSSLRRIAQTAVGDRGA